MMFAHTEAVTNPAPSGGRWQDFALVWLAPKATVGFFFFGSVLIITHTNKTQ